MEYRLVREEGFEYIEQGTGPVMVLLHGLFGALSNWNDVLREFSRLHTVVIPLMPIYSNTRVSADVEGLTKFVSDFLNFKKLNGFSLIGNSLGGHVALMYTLTQPQRVANLVLTGSSGLFESGMGIGFPRRGDYNYIRERVEFTFYSPKTATKELVDEVFETVNDSQKALRIIQIARAAQRQNMRAMIRKITCPTLLVWGLNDNITPPDVAHEFNRLIPHSKLHFIDHCGHAAMMEQSERFNHLVHRFYQDIHFQNN